MFGKLLRGAGRRLGLRVFFALAAVSASATTVAAQSAPYVHGGVRWIGSAPDCKAPAGWTATRLFRSAALPAALTALCVYAWIPVAGTAPTSADVSLLFSASGALDMTEDVPVVLQMTPFSAAQEAFSTGLRTALRAQVGDASLLPSVPAHPAVRIVVIDSAPDAPAGQIHPGASRHGDTLAHLIEDLVCLPAATSDGRTCAAEVTTALALDGGRGTLSDLARAIERAVSTWESDRRSAPSSTPARLVLNLSLGWEDTPRIADCSAESPDRMGPPARAVFGILRHAADRGALVVAAAGNDAGGPAPRTGLMCPGRYQQVPHGAPSRSLVLAVSGVDYRDRPLESARPLGITGIAGLGLGGVAWDPVDPVPPPLTGSSVAAAVVSAISALVWADQPTWTPGQITRAVYQGGIDVGAADECPLSLGPCRSHRASVCGALNAAGASLPCSPAAPGASSSPALPGEVAVMTAAFSSLLPTSGTVAPPPGTLPRHVVPTIQIQPWVAPMPIAETCPVCVVSASQLAIPAIEQDLQDAVLVMQFADGTTQAVALVPTLLASTTAYSFALPPPPTPTCGPIKSAYLTAIGLPASPSLPSYSVTEQIFVDP